MLLGHMSIEVLREEACDCLFEIVNKGMDPVDKMKLVESLCRVLQSAGFFSIDQVSKFMYKVLKMLEQIRIGSNLNMLSFSFSFCFVFKCWKLP